MPRKQIFDIEPLERRRLLATVTVNAGSVIRTLNDDVLGVNLAWWDSTLNTAQTKTMVQAAGLTSFRFPGGSSADEFHFTDPPSYNGKGTAATFAKFIESVNGGGMVTLDYGSGSPQEGAAFLAYLNATTSNSTSIGTGQTWPTGGSAWTNRDYKTAAYWAGIRAANPIAPDDGLNFLRINHPAPFAFHFYEIGNEEYGLSWETDHHAPPHDPATYVSFAKQFAALAAQIDPSIAIGLDIVAGSEQNNWTSNVLTQCANQSYTPNFLIDHNYVYGPNQENDNTLLHSVSVPGYSGWSSRAAQYRTLLQQKLGANAANVRLLATEFNSVYSGPGKQTTSLVGGLFAADAIGSILSTEYDGLWFWDLRNGWDTTHNNSATLYGWRQGGDYGMLGTSGAAPSTGTYVPYPTYFAEQLAAKIAKDGASVISASSNDTNLATYAVKQTNGHVTLLVINKSSTSSLTGNFQFSGGFLPDGQAQFTQYGKTEDTAQSQTTNGAASATSFSQTVSLSGNTWSVSFPSYSMTAIDLTPLPAPVVMAESYPFDVRPDAVQASFNVDVSSSLTASDLLLAKLDGGTAPTVQSVQWDAGTKTATFAFVPGNLPPDGSYQAKIPAASVSNAAGNSLAADVVFNFFILSGDADRSHTVDSVDFNILVSNFGMTGLPFSQGNFNYDNTVDTIDFNLLAANFGDTVAAPAASALPLSRRFTPAAAQPDPVAQRPAWRNDIDSLIDLADESSIL